MEPPSLPAEGSHDKGPTEFITSIMPVMYSAYQSENPIQVLLEWLKKSQWDLNWNYVRSLMTHVRWNKSSASDKNHPLHFILQDIQTLRSEDLIDKTGTEQNMMALLRFCHFATCMPHIWVNDVHVQDNAAFVWSKSKTCAFAAPNVAVPFVWLQADYDTEVRMIDCFAPPGFRMQRLYVAVYRRVVGGILPQLRVAWQITHANGKDNDLKDNKEAMRKTSYMLHLVIDLTGKPKFNVLRPVADVTFMILLTEGRNRRFVSCQLNDGKNGKLIPYPTCFHIRSPDECR